MGAGDSRYSDRRRIHRRKIKKMKGMFTDDAQDGDLILMRDRVARGDDLMKVIEGDQSQKKKNVDKTQVLAAAKNTDFLDLELVQGIMKSQMGRATVTQLTNVNGWNRVGMVVTDRLGTRRLLMATSKGLESPALDKQLKEFKENGTLVAIRQLHCNRANTAMMDTIRSVLDFTAGKDNSLPWKSLKKSKKKGASDFNISTSARTFAKSLLLKVGEAPFVMSEETKSEIQHFFEIYDVDGDGTIDEDEMEVMLAELLKDKVTTEERLKFISRLDADNDGDISFQEFFYAVGDLPGMVSRETRDTLGLISAQFVTLVYQRMNLIPDPSMYEPIEPMSYSWILEKAGEGVELTDGSLFPEVPLRVRKNVQRTKKKRSTRQDAKHLKRLKRGKKDHVVYEPIVHQPAPLAQLGNESFADDKDTPLRTCTPNSPFAASDKGNYMVEFGDGPLGIGFQSGTYEGEDSVEVIAVSGVAESCGVKVGDMVEEVVCLATKKLYSIGHEFVDQDELGQILRTTSRPIKVEFVRPRDKNAVTPSSVTPSSAYTPSRDRMDSGPMIERVDVTFQPGSLGMAFAQITIDGESYVGVCKVLPDSQADKVGVEVGDRFLVIGTEEISPSAERSHILNLIGTLPRPLEVTLGRLVEEDFSPSPTPTPSGRGRALSNISEASEPETPSSIE